jgi:hypothetical protein
MTYPAEARFAKFISRVNAILTENPAFRRGENCQFVDDGHPAVIAAFRQDPATQALGFLIVCNFDTQNSQRISVELAPFRKTDGAFECQELLSGEPQRFPHSQMELLLEPCSAQVLRFSTQ